MDKPYFFKPDNWVCRNFGHWYGRQWENGRRWERRAAGRGTFHRACHLCGHIHPALPGTKVDS